MGSGWVLFESFGTHVIWRNAQVLPNIHHNMRAVEMDAW
jgi:hypothetical protein